MSSTHTRAQHRDRQHTSLLTLALALLLGLVVALTAAQSGAAGPRRDTLPTASGPDPLAVVAAFGAAWNRHDLDGVVAAFAPNAVVRQATRLVDHPGDSASALVLVDDVYGARLQYDVGAVPFAVEGGAAVWRGRAAIRVWARDLFALRHRAEASGFAVSGGPAGLRNDDSAISGVGGDSGEREVRWRYRAHVDFFQTIPGVPPVEGTATATVRDGMITALTLAGSEASWARRADAMQAVLQTAGERAPPAQGSPPAPAAVASVPAPPSVALQPPVWGDAAWPLALAGLGAGAYALAAVRRRARAGTRP